MPIPGPPAGYPHSYPVGNEDEIDALFANIANLVVMTGLLIPAGSTGAQINSILASATSMNIPCYLAAGTVYSVEVTITVPTNGRLNLNGSTLKSAIPGDNSRLLSFTNVNNIDVYNGFLDGDKGSYIPVTEQRHNILITGCSSIRLSNLFSKNAKGDGVYVGDQFGGSADIYMWNVTCDSNYRNGISISAVDGLLAIGCNFRRTGGTAPEAGIDVEPNTDTSLVRNVRFIACDMAFNNTYGSIISCRPTATVTQGNIDFVACTQHENNDAGSRVVAGRDIRYIGGSLNNNQNRGLHFSAVTPNIRDVLVNGTTIRGNGRHGILTDAAFTRFTVVNSFILDNCSAVNAPGCDISPTAASSGFVFSNNVSGNEDGATQTHGLRTNANVSNVTMGMNEYPGNITAPVTLGDDVTTRMRVDVTGTDSNAVGTYTAKATWTSAFGNTILGIRTTGDTVDRVALRTDGVITFSTGAIAQDTQLSRVAVGVLGVGAAQCIRTGKNTTANRPNAATVGGGSQFYDTTLGKPIWSDGANWRDAAGTIV